jgi:purine-cytosine permease-like protein
VAVCCSVCFETFEKNAKRYLTLLTVAIVVGHVLGMAFAVFWEILWPLILGFGLSALVQAVVSKSGRVPDTEDMETARAA